MQITSPCLYIFIKKKRLKLKFNTNLIYHIDPVLDNHHFRLMKDNVINKNSYYYMLCLFFDKYCYIAKILT